MWQAFRSSLRVIFFLQASGPIRLAQSRPLQLDDLPSLPELSDPAQVPGEFMRFQGESAWDFMRKIFWIVRLEMVKAGALAFSYALCLLLTPWLVYRLVDFVARAAQGQVAMGSGLVAGLLLCLVGSMTGILQHHYYHVCLRILQRTVSGLNMRIYRHSLNLTRKARLKRPSGDLINLMGTDTDIVSTSLFDSVELCTRLFILVAASMMLISLLGWAGVAGLLMLIAVLPLSRRIILGYVRLDDELMVHRDARVSLVAQMLAGIRIVKFFAWERQIGEEVKQLRSREIRARRRLISNSARSLFMHFSASLLVGLAAFATALALGQELHAADIFACLSLFTMLDNAVGGVTELLPGLAAARVSAERIRNFLQEPELSVPASRPHFEGAPGLSWREVSYRYEDAAAPVLSDLRLDIAPASAVAIVGAVGAGKSSLILGLLGELPSEGAKAEWTGIPEGLEPRLAYVPQEAFIVNGTLKDNILLGRKDHSPAQLAQALYASCLDYDCQLLPGGLDAEIGEQGINLSGGQKQRVNLARAVMMDAGLVLLDDPLSAVDFATEDKLIERLIFGLWQDKTRLVVTHRLHHLDRFDQVIFVHQGRLAAVGTLAELLERSPAFREFYADTDAAETLHEKTKDPLDSSLPVATDFVRQNEEEERAIGGVQGAIYRLYGRSLLGANPKVVGAQLLTAALLTIGLPLLQNTWLASWANHRGSEPQHTEFANWLPAVFAQAPFAIGLWGALGLLAVVAAVCHQLLWLRRALLAGADLHDQAFAAVLRAPLQFFDRTPVGRILNRFSRDVDAVEREVATNLERTLVPIFHALTAMILLIAMVPYLAAFILPALYGYYMFQRRYRAASRDAQRLMSIARSPRFAYFKETLQNTSVVRAHGLGTAFEMQFQHILTQFQRSFYGVIVFNRWFSSRIPLLGGFISFGLVSSILLLARNGAIAAGTAGLALVYALKLWEYLNSAIRSFTMVESNLISVERLQHFRSLPAEHSVLQEPALASANSWPSRGSIRIEGVSTRYAPDLPWVLRDCHLQLEAGSKTGIIGRTGAGKSTIFQLLFRFIDPVEGRITIDGIDTATIPLARLRESMAIIPQDPILFKGTLRSNLDRFAQFSDEAIYDALRRAHLKQWLLGLEGGLHADVKENGGNFSQGQRQLLCLARAILLDTRIIVMDEATASVDITTDALIQRTIREEFADRTVLMIAHRLETLELCDQVVEMENGRVKHIQQRRVLQQSVAHALPLEA